MPPSSCFPDQTQCHGSYCDPRQQTEIPISIKIIPTVHLLTYMKSVFLSALGNIIHIWSTKAGMHCTTHSLHLDPQTCKINGKPQKSKAPQICLWLCLCWHYAWQIQSISFLIYVGSPHSIQFIDYFCRVSSQRSFAVHIHCSSPKQEVGERLGEVPPQAASILTMLNGQKYEEKIWAWHSPHSCPTLPLFLSGILHTSSPSRL